MKLLQTMILFLGAALIMVPLLKRLGLASVIGYLATGVILGPHVMALISDTHQVLEFSEFGVVMLLFLIGLELQPSRLWVLRRSVFGLGGLQVGLTGLLFMGAGLILGFSPGISFIIGFGLAMSSTAFVLQLLAEKNQLTSEHGRKAFAILLFQDLAVVPLLAAIPLLAGQQTDFDWMDVGKAIGVVGIFVISSRTLVRPVFRFIAGAGAQEMFTAAALFIVIGASILTELLGASMAMGAFAAGVLLADSEFRHELEASLQPFKGILLGLFFIAVGMTADMTRLVHDPITIIGLSLLLMITKGLLLMLIGHLSGANRYCNVHLGVSLAQGGEFAFVLFTAAAAAADKLLPADLAEQLILIVTLTMALTPLAFIVLEKFIDPHLRPQDKRTFDDMPEHDSPVIIAGFGRFGQIVARVLRMHHIPFTALEADVRQVDFVRRFGNRVYYGNPANIELLRAAGAAKAKIFVLAMDHVEDSLRTAKSVHHHFPNITIYARARDRAHAYQLMDLGVKIINRETYLSSLDLARNVLMGLGISEDKAAEGVARFQQYDEALMRRQHAIYQDEASSD
jgi:glutathione-regulated potassium-efflux system protein KefB